MASVPFLLEAAVEKPEDELSPTPASSGPKHFTDWLSTEQHHADGLIWSNRATNFERAGWKCQNKFLIEKRDLVAYPVIPAVQAGRWEIW